MQLLYVQSPAKVTDESLGARKNAKNAKDQEHRLNYWTGVEIRQLDIQNQAC
jgi:hypothetical protein